MTVEWQTRPLGELCEFQRGLTYSKGDEVDRSANVVLRAMNIDIASHLLDFTDLKYISDQVVVPASKKVKKNSLMICTASGSKSHLGKIAFIDDDYGYAFGGFMGLLTPNGDLVPKYLFHLMTSGAYEDFIGALAAGMNINNLKFEDLRQFQVPYPPLPEQQRIVGILDETFAAIATARANTEQNRRNAQIIFEGYLQSVLVQRGEGWDSRPFDDCIDDVKYTKKVQRNQFLQQGAYPIVSQEADFTNGYWDDASDVFRVARPVVIFGDHTMVLKYVDFDFVLGADGVKILQPKRFLIPKFFFYCLRSARLKSLGYARHYRLLKELVIRFPGLDEQTAIAEKLDDLDEETRRLASIYERKLAALDALKQSLLHQAFAGAL
jgi:type I restriction enzyme, S subunit